MANFYHSFPRPRARQKATDQAAKGLSILRSILDFGFLLTPERLTWREGVGNERRLESFARRMCFTLLEETELADHAKAFGPFAISLRVDSLISLGGLPALYLPHKPPNSDGLSELGTAYLQKLAEIERLLRVMAATEDAVRNDPFKARKLRFKSLDTGAEREVACTVENAVALLDGWVKENKISNVVELYRAFVSFVELVYPAGNATRLNVGDIGYYQQREWKLSGQITYEGDRLTRPPTSEERERFLGIDRDFFGRELQFLSESKTVAERCLVFPQIGTQKVQTFIEEVIVPWEAVEPAKALIAGHEFPIKLKALKGGLLEPVSIV